MSATQLIRTGPQANPISSNPFTQRGGYGGEGLVSELRGRYYQSTRDGNVFSVQTQGTSVTTTAALATTFTGLAVGNPASSNYNLSLISFSCAQFAVGAAGEIGIMGGVGSITASLTPQNRIIGSGILSLAGATATAGQTISTPTLIETFGSIGSLATTGYGLIQAIKVYFDGSIIVPPGSFLASYTAVVTTSALQFSFCWEEIPIAG